MRKYGSCIFIQNCKSLDFAMYAMHIEGFGIHIDLVSIAPYLMLSQLNSRRTYFIGFFLSNWGFFQRLLEYSGKSTKRKSYNLA